MSCHIMYDFYLFRLFSRVTNDISIDVYVSLERLLDVTNSLIECYIRDKCSINYLLQ
jgi:hypothetical protein